MQIVTREEAITRQSARYFTGKPCKRGHISERYTKMAACIECLHPKFTSIESRRRGAMALVKLGEKREQERLAVVARSLDRIKIRLHPNDVELFESALLAAAIGHEPSMGLRHLRTRFVPKIYGKEIRLHCFRCFPEDKSTLFALQDSLESVRRPTVAPLSPQQRLEAALAMVDKQLPDWTERP